MSTDSEEPDAILAGGSPKPAAAPLAVASRIGRLFETRAARIGGILAAAAAAATAVETLTGFGSKTYVAARQMAFAPQINASLRCGQSVIGLHAENIGRTSVSVGEPVVIWMERDEPPRPPALYVPRAKPPATALVKFPIVLEPGQPLDVRLEHESDGFYVTIDPDSARAQSGMCQLKIRLPVENEPGSRRGDKELTCNCV